MAGTLISTMGKGWPTGPFIVIAFASIFIVSMVFGAQRGLLICAIQLRMQRKYHEQGNYPISRQAVKEGK